MSNTNNLMSHVLMNKLDDDLSDAIVSVGGDISNAKGPWDYPNIIRTQLSACGGQGTPTVNIKIGEGLKVVEVNGEQRLTATSDAISVRPLDIPGCTCDDNNIPAGTSLQVILEKLFSDVLPNMAISSGDIVKASKDGTDQYGCGNIKTGLIPGGIYLRLFNSEQHEPVYIVLSGHGIVNDEIDGLPSTPSPEYKEYEGSVGQHITISIDGNVIRAELNQSTIDAVDSINKIKTDLDSKANLSDLNTVKTALDSKADKETIDNTIEELRGDVSNMETVLDSKADIEYVETTVTEKVIETVTETIKSDDVKTQIEEIVKNVTTGSDMTDEEVSDFTDDLFNGL